MHYLFKTTTFKTTLLFLFACCVLSNVNGGSTNWAALYARGALVAGALLTSVVVVVAARATMLTWITVLVLLTFSGKRRRVLVQHGKKITIDVVMYLIKGQAY